MFNNWELYLLLLKSFSLHNKNIISGAWWWPHWAFSPPYLHKSCPVFLCDPRGLRIILLCSSLLLSCESSRSIMQTSVCVVRRSEYWFITVHTELFRVHFRSDGCHSALLTWPLLDCWFRPHNTRLSCQIFISHEPTETLNQQESRWSPETATWPHWWAANLVLRSLPQGSSAQTTACCLQTRTKHRNLSVAVYPALGHGMYVVCGQGEMYRGTPFPTPQVIRYVGVSPPQYQAQSCWIQTPLLS